MIVSITKSRAGFTLDEAIGAAHIEPNPDDPKHYTLVTGGRLCLAASITEQERLNLVTGAAIQKEAMGRRGECALYTIKSLIA